MIASVLLVNWSLVVVAASSAVVAGGVKVSVVFVMFAVLLVVGGVWSWWGFFFWHLQCCWCELVLVFGMVHAVGAILLLLFGVGGVWCCYGFRLWFHSNLVLTAHSHRAQLPMLCHHEELNAACHSLSAVLCVTTRHNVFHP